MRTHTRQTHPRGYVFCLLLVSVLLCLTVFAAVPENGVNAPMLGDRPNTADRGTARNRSADTGAVNAVTDAVGEIGEAVSDAGNAVGEVIGDIGNAAGEVVSDAGNALGNAADAIGGTVNGANGGNSANGTITGNQNNTADSKAEAAMPFDTHSAENTTGASGTVTKEDTAPAGMSWILILILIAAAAAIFFLILMPKRTRDM